MADVPPSTNPIPAADAHRLPTDTDDGMLLIISGPSGVGKTTITRGVERSISDAVFSVSATTRPKTAADVEGVDYHFVSDAEFERMRAENAFLETTEIYSNKYGTPADWVRAQLARGRLVILEIDVPGAVAVKSRLPEAFAVFILPPDEMVLLERLRARKREAEDVIQRRFSKARDEIARARTCGVYNVFLVNDDLNSTIARAIEIVRSERAQRTAQRRARQSRTATP
ncbi:MAG: guanylate kinase [Planctomycetota bacterium]|nr:guanylate kinase [Planctomycetota bacterium]